MTRECNSMAFKFHQVLRECIEDGLRNVVGESGMKAVLFRIESGQFIDNPEEFHRDLCLIFNDNGAEILEKVIIKELFRRLSLLYEERDDFDFASYVNQAKEFFIANRREIALALMKEEINE